jgi:hypothetical protein
VLVVVIVPKFKPSLVDKSKALPFNKIVPISGKNKPYDPYVEVYPFTS